MASTSWMPSEGRHPVNIGSSLGRAIKARKLKDSPAPAAKRSNLPERDFFAFRFNFKASSIDSNKPASIETKKGPENTQVLAEYPSKEANEVHVFSGNEHPAKEVDCVLIYDEETGQYVLEKLDSFVHFKYERKKAISPAAASPAPVPSSSSASSSKARARREDDEDLERLLLDESGLAADDMMDVLPSLNRHAEEEEEEGEEIEVALARQTAPAFAPPKPQPSQSQTKVAPAAANTRPMKSLPKSKVESKPPPKPPAPAPAPTPASAIATPTNAARAGLPAKPTIAPAPAAKPAPTPVPAPTISAVVPAPPKAKVPRPGKKAKPAAQAPAVSSTHVDEETDRTAKPPKRPRPSTSTVQSKPPPPPPEPKAPAELFLPGMGGSGFVAPPPPPGSAASSKRPPAVAAPIVPPTTSISVPPGVSATITMVEEGSDEDEDWEAVPTSAGAVAPQSYDLELEDEIFGDGFGMDDGDTEPIAEVDHEGEEIDVNAFEAELNEQMEDWGGEEDPIFGTLGEDADDDDDMEDAMEDAVAGSGQPISLNRLAGGESEDDYSSSDSDSD